MRKKQASSSSVRKWLSETITAPDNLRTIARSFWSDTSGAILPYVTIMLVVIIGFSTLAVDGSRYTGLHTHLQNGADALALAGAAELDRLPDSIDRANLAIATLIDNKFNVGSGQQNIASPVIRFYAELPANDADPLSAETLDPIEARFIYVETQPVTMPVLMPLWALVPGVNNTATTRASAVAGMNRVSCGITPMFICNPFEPPDNKDYGLATKLLVDAEQSEVAKRKLIKLEDPGPSGTWGPGSFGYLVPESGTLPSDSCFPAAGSDIGTAMATDRPPACFVQNAVNLQPGNAQAGRRGLNTRFGLYDEGLSNNATCRAKYPPDTNVRKGYQAKGKGADAWCTSDPEGSWPPGTAVKSYPLDENLITSTTTNIGDGIWNCIEYWVTTYGSTFAPPSGCTDPDKGTNPTISRRELYEFERKNPAILNHPNATGETGAAQCQPASAKADRRVLFVAIVNCSSSPVAIQSKAANVPVAGIGKFFLTIPNPGSAHNSNYAEFMGLTQTGVDGNNYDQVQLYR